MLKVWFIRLTLLTCESKISCTSILSCDLADRLWAIKPQFDTPNYTVHVKSFKTAQLECGHYIICKLCPNSIKMYWAKCKQSVSHKSCNFMFPFPFVLRQSDHGIICPLVVMVVWFACLQLAKMIHYTYRNIFCQSQICST